MTGDVFENVFENGFEETDGREEVNGINGHVSDGSRESPAAADEIVSGAGLPAGRRTFAERCGWELGRALRAGRFGL